MHDWSQTVGLMDFCALYFTTQLARCAVFSVVLMGLVMLLRKVFFRERVFLRGMSWALFVVIPFLGKLKLFYENEMVVRLTWRMTAVTMSWRWVGRMYMAGILVSVICIFGKWLRLRRSVAGMEKVVFEHVCIHVMDMKVTPFTVGLLKPKIVLPKVMMDSFSEDERKIIVQHELTHIRLGHLWCGFAWDLLRCFLWVNPFLSIFQKQFRADLEDICDKVCIQNSGTDAYEYGMILLKSLKMLRPGREDISPAAAYAGEKGFADMKRRMQEIAGFRPYRKRMCMGMAAGAVLVIMAALLAIHTHSYARCNESTDIMVCKYDGVGAIVSQDTEDLSRMISYDNEYVYVEREPFEDFLRENNAEGEIYIYFGGFYKLPGLGGASEACFYESDPKEETVRIPYESMRGDWYYELLRML